mmetsp:Transcript_11892/g.22273  ORF Transcript_11892/g.22273 Transcript_11892/m.22273 type:complete len:617 (+) Transcript_11892:204-2054(+)
MKIQCPPLIPLPPPLKRRLTRSRQRYSLLHPMVTNNKIFQCLQKIPPFSICTFYPRDIVHIIASSILYVLGPILVIVTFALLFCLSWTFWNVILPLRFGSSSLLTRPAALIHQGFVVFVLINIIFNYVLCVSTRNGHGSKRYKAVVQELARATGFHYPETMEQTIAWRKEWHNNLIRMTRQRILQERYEQRRDLGLLDDDDYNDDGDYDYDDDTISKGHPNGIVQYDIESDGIHHDGRRGTRTKPTVYSSQDTNVTNATTTAASSISASTVKSSATSGNTLKTFIKKRKNGGTLDGSCSSYTAGEISKNQSHQYHSSIHRTPLSMHGRGSWMTLGPYDWSYCERTQLPKPPRSHYDHVTQSLVLNMDHYCPWMFNCIGYFNYRYFVNFLIYVAMGMVYGALVSFHPFMMIDSLEYKEQIVKSKELFMAMMQVNDGSSNIDNHIDGELVKKSFHYYSHVQHLIPNVPIPSEATPIAFSFMMCFAVGLSVIVLLGFHLYLILSAQTTIEFHGNRFKKQQCQFRKESFCNPYDMGLRRNMEQVWGRWGKDGQGSWFLVWIVFLPSFRESEFLPVPIKGDVGLRKHWKKDDSSVLLHGSDDELHGEKGMSGGGLDNFNVV